MSRLTVTLGQMEMLALLLDGAELDLEIRGEALAREPAVRLRGLPEGGLAATVVVDIVNLGRAELAEVPMDKLGCALPTPPAPRRSAALPGPLSAGMRATRKSYA